MKLLFSIFALITLSCIPNASALIIDFKEWSFKATSETWYEISTRYDDKGRLICSTTDCRAEYWASSEDLSAMLAAATTEQLLKGTSSQFPIFLGETRPSLCGGMFGNDCIWHGWLRDEHTSDSQMAR